MFEIVVFIAGGVIGTVAGWLIVREKLKNSSIHVRAELEQQCAVISERLERVTGELEQERNKTQLMVNELTELRNGKEAVAVKLAGSESKLTELEKNEAEKNRLITDLEKKNTDKDSEIRQLDADKGRLNAQLRELETRLEEQQKQAEEKLKLLVEAKEQLAEQFKNLANDILDTNSKKFTEQNQIKLDAVMKPLGEKMKDFEKKVEDSYVKGAKERSSLVEQLKNLQSLNQQLSRGAENLTKALKGDSKLQGNWGEIVLERILEASGMQKGREYQTQESFSTEQGRYQPDVIINLPDGKTVIIDAKVSLTAYERYCSAENSSPEQAVALKEHLTSIKNHLKLLSGKNYQDLPELKSLDFVLMFIPIEPAFAIAVQADQELLFQASKQNITLVTASTLLATLRTIAYVWRQEDQQRNASEIARLAGEMYNKFEGFIADLDSVGNRISQLHRAYDAARNKLVDGRGNLVRTAGKIKDLGARTNKKLPDALIEAAEDEHNIEQLTE
ncbi:MAG: DNA recombination protein RmuC [Victivallaceae bacterium]|nr:DNA recombination protein RmuC [Victivallaceae bacterium]